jgi:hypothetical protein
MKPTGSLLFPGDAVTETSGPLRCSASGRDGRVCGAFVGMPALGSILVRIEPAALLLGPERGFYAYRCPRCGAVAIFATPHNPKEVT